MDRQTQSGQLVIELVILTLFFVGLFLTTYTITQSAGHRQKQFRFSSAKTQTIGGSW